jgi:uncharacterized small protein (DUF1192 family)
MSKQNQNQNQTTTPKVNTLADMAETTPVTPTPESAQAQPQAQTVPQPVKVESLPVPSVAELEKAIATLQSEIVKLESQKITPETAQRYVNIISELTTTRIKLESAKVADMRTNFTADIDKVVKQYQEKFSLDIAKMLYTVTKDEKGVQTTSVKINTELDSPVKKTGTRKAGGGKKTMWKNTTTGEVKSAKEVYEAEFKGSCDGASKIGAWSRVIESLHKAQKAMNYQPVTA